MKSPLLAAIVALQLVTLGLVVGLLLKRNGPAENPDLLRLTQAVNGALNQERVIVQYLEDLRSEAARRVAKGNPSAETPATGGAGDEATKPSPTNAPAHADATAAAPSSPFPEASTALAELKKYVRHLRDELKGNGQNTAPLKQEIASRKDALIARGRGAVWVVQHEVDLQPFEPDRDPDFVVYLLDEVVPPLSSNAKDETFEIARGALVRQTNEPAVKLAAARALQAIDHARWVKDVCDVIALGGSREIDLRSHLLGMFEAEPHPEIVELCKRFLDDARQPIELRTRAIAVLAKQDSSAVIPELNRVLFEDPAAILKIQALDALWDLLKTPEEKRRLADRVAAEDPARMPASVQEKAQRLVALL
jgi:hypothetical protein